MTYCPVCHRPCSRGTFKTGVYNCASGHKWYNCRRCKKLRINVGDTHGICSSCDGSTIDDRMLSYHQSVEGMGNARLGIIKQPDMFMDTRRGGRLDDARVSDFVFGSPAMKQVHGGNIISDRPSRADDVSRDTAQVLAPRPTQLFTSDVVGQESNPFLNRFIPKDTVYNS